MKIFDINWSYFLKRAAIWETLATDSRAVFLQLTGKSQTYIDKFGTDASTLLETQCLASTTGQRCCVHESCYDFSKAVRAMLQQPLFAADALTPRNYVHKHFSHEELTNLCRGPNAYYHHDADLIRLVTSVEWHQKFLSAEALPAWEQSKVSRRSPRLLKSPDVAAALKSLVQHFADHPVPAKFSELEQIFPNTAPGTLGIAILAAIRYLLLFPGMGADLLPQLGLWPAVSERLARPTLQPPLTVKPDQKFHVAVPIVDLTTLLIAAAGEPLRLRANDGRLFASVVKSLAPNLYPLPGWLTEFLRRTEPEYRLEDVVRLAESLDVGKRVYGPQHAFKTTAKGERWLAESPNSRMRVVIAKINKLVRAEWVEPHSSHNTARQKSRLITAAMDACRWLDGRGFVRMADFLAWHSESVNPYVAMARSGKRVSLRSSWSNVEPTCEEMERYWHNDLNEFLWSSLYPTGGLDIGFEERNCTLCIALSDIGRFQLGLADDLNYGPAQGRPSEIVVQPNFEIVFLSAAPMAEAVLSRFAERKSTGLGVLFKLTKAAIFSAAAMGTKCEQVLDQLREISTKELPANVVREVEGWFGRCRTVTVRNTVLIRCPDADTATHVLSACGKKGNLLTDTIVELPDAKARKAVIQKMKKAGIFVGK